MSIIRSIVEKMTGQLKIAEEKYRTELNITTMLMHQNNVKRIEILCKRKNKSPELEMLSKLGRIELITNDLVPLDKIVCTDSNGNIIKIITLGEKDAISPIPS